MNIYKKILFTFLAAAVLTYIGCSSSGDDSTPLTAALTIITKGQYNDSDAIAGLSAGDTLTYTFDVTNTGNVTVTGVSINVNQFDLPGPIAITPPANIDLSLGETKQWMGTYTLTQADIDNTFASVDVDVDNLASATGTAPDGSSVTSNQDPAEIPLWVAGIYTGKFTETGSSTSGDVVLLVASDNHFALAALDGSEYNIGTVSGSNLTAGSFVATLTAALSGTFSDSATGLSGTFTLTDAGIYNRTSDTSKLVGQWTDVDNSIVYTIQASGAFDATITSCDAQGTFATIDSSKNEYDFTMNVVSCPGLNGDFTGLAFTDDFSGGTDNQIVIITENQSLQKFIISAPVKN